MGEIGFPALRSWLAAGLVWIALTTSVLAAAPEAGPRPVPPSWSAQPSVEVLTEAKTFRNGETDFSGTMYYPRNGQALGAVVVMHSASKPLREALLYRHLVEMLPQLGFAVLVYDRRGSGGSGGNLNASDYPMLADDAIAAVRMLKADPRIDPRRIGIWGLSQGGWLSLLAASRSPDVRFVISISAPLVPPDVQMLFRSENAMRINGFTDGEIAQMRAMRLAVDDYMKGSGDRETAQRLVDAAKDKPWFELLYMGPRVGDRATSRWRKEIEYDPLPTLDRVKVPALILFGAADPVVPVATSVARIEAGSRPNVTLRVIAFADHHMATSVTPKDQMNAALAEHARPDSVEYFATLVSWLTRQGLVANALR